MANAKIKVQDTFIDFGSSTSETWSIDEIDQSKAFILVEGTAGNSNINWARYRAYFSANDEVTIERSSQNGDGYASVYVVSCDPNDPDPAFTVEHGDLSFTASDTGKTDNISSIGDTDQCSVIVSATCSVNSTPAAFIRGKLNSTTEVGLYRNTASGTCDATYYVVKWNTDCNVYTGTTTNSSTSNTSNIGGTVDLSRSVLFFTWDNDTDGLAQHSTRGIISSTTQVQFKRATSTGSNTVEWSVVEFPSDVVVQADNGTDTPTIGTGTDVNDTVSTYDTTASFLVHSADSTGTGGAKNRSRFVNSLVDSTTIQFDKIYTGQTQNISYFLVDVSGWEYTTGDTPVVGNKYPLPAFKNIT